MAVQIPAARLLLSVSLRGQRLAGACSRDLRAGLTVVQCCDVRNRAEHTAIAFDLRGVDLCVGHQLF